jgi:hypothetical protein
MRIHLPFQHRDLLARRGEYRGQRPHHCCAPGRHLRRLSQLRRSQRGPDGGGRPGDVAAPGPLAPRRGQGAAPPPGLGTLGGRPSFAGPPAASSIAILLLRRMAADRETIDLSVSPQ